MPELANADVVRAFVQLRNLLASNKELAQQLKKLERKVSSHDEAIVGILKAIRAYRYNLQAYFYRLCYETAYGRRLLGFRFLFIEKAPPYATAVVEIGPELMSYAVTDFEKALQTYRECTTLGEWPAYTDEVQVIDIKASSVATPITFA